MDSISRLHNLEQIHIKTHGTGLRSKTNTLVLRPHCCKTQTCCLFRSILRNKQGRIETDVSLVIYRYLIKIVFIGTYLRHIKRTFVLILDTTYELIDLYHFLAT